MKQIAAEERIANFFRNISQPDRVRILLTIGEGEACVCHLEAALGLRQAYISQHLMALREAHILKTRRDGRFIFYRLVNAELLVLVQMAGRILGVRTLDLKIATSTAGGLSCPCPNCEDEPAKMVAGTTRAPIEPDTLGVS